eukprot:scaffold1307_cov200-Pinguiococcus_pyrenoidosus.AAC.90
MDSVRAAWLAEQATAGVQGRKPSKKRVAEMTGLHYSSVRRRLRADWTPRQRGGAMNKKLSEEAVALLEVYVAQGVYSRDKYYRNALEEDLNIQVSTRTVSRCLRNQIGSTIVKAQADCLDKWSEAGEAKLWDFFSDICDAPRACMRFYDQTGASFNEFQELKRRKLPSHLRGWHYDLHRRQRYSRRVYAPVFVFMDLFHPRQVDRGHHFGTGLLTSLQSHRRLA